MDWNSWFGWWGGMGVMMLIGMVFMVFFWGGIIFLVVWILRQYSAPGRHEPTTRTTEAPTPLEIAKQRYARGEITKEQYEQLKRDIEA
jgi:putative membrane protein